MVNNVGIGSNALWPSNNVKTKNQQQTPHVPQGFGRVGGNLTATAPNLTERESEIFDRIRDMVGGPVKFNLGCYTGECGRTITTIGFVIGATERTPFMITHDMLREMAADENVYRERMAWVQEMLQLQNDSERSFAENKMRTAQEDAERRGNAIRSKVQSVVDSFWNVDRNENGSVAQANQNQIREQVANRYEQNLSIQ